MTKIKFIFQILYGQIINKNTSKNILMLTELHKQK